MRPTASTTALIRNSALDYTAFVYDSSSDSYTCPEGQTLSYLRSWRRKDRPLRIYEAHDCTACPLKARELLNSPPGKEYRSRRMIEVESVFGQIKHNGNFRRFFLRGLSKVNTEFHLVTLAHNLKKWWATTQPRPA